jgi:hypothetical protein
MKVVTQPMRRFGWDRIGPSLVTAALVFAAVLGTVPVLGHPSAVPARGTGTMAAPLAAASPRASASAVSSVNPTPAQGNASVSGTFTGGVVTNGLKYVLLPANLTYNLTITNSTIANITGITVAFEYAPTILTCSPLPSLLPECPVVWNFTQDLAWATSVTTTSATFYFTVNEANFTTYPTTFGFVPPAGPWNIVAFVTATDPTGASSTTAIVAGGENIAFETPHATLAQPVNNTNISAGSVVLAGNWSGYFVTSANLTVVNSTGGIVASFSIYAPGIGSHAFSEVWSASAGTYSVIITLGTAWTSSYKITSTVHVAAPLSQVYYNSTGLIPGLGNGGSAAVIITIGLIVGMLVMYAVGRSLFGGPKPAAAAQPWTAPKPGTNECSVCHQTFPNEEELKEHAKSQHGITM